MKRKHIDSNGNTVEVIGNGHYREIVYGFDLSEKEQAEFDFLESDELDTSQFVRFKGDVLYVGDFLTTRPGPWNAGSPEWLQKYDGYKSDSYFSGLLVKFSRDMEAVQVFTYIS